MRNLNLSVKQDAPLHIWKVPSAVRLRESLSEHRAVFLKVLYTATVTAAAKMFEKKIYVWNVDPGDASFSLQFDRPLYKKKEGG